MVRWRRQTVLQTVAQKLLTGDRQLLDEKRPGLTNITSPFHSEWHKGLLREPVK